MSRLQLGHLNLFCSQGARQSEWNVWPQPGMHLTLSSCLKSLRHIVHDLNLNDFFSVLESLEEILDALDLPSRLSFGSPLLIE